MNKKANNSAEYTRKLVFAAILLAFTLVVNYFTKITIPIGGAPVLRISFGGPFLKMAAILLGPLYGGICGALSDYLGEVIRPTGAYLWPLTVTAFLHNALIGILWLLVKKINFRKYNVAYISVFSALILFGAINFTAAKLFPDSGITRILLNMGASRRDSDTLSIGMLAAGTLGLAAHLLAWLVSRKNRDSNAFEQYMRLIVCVMLPGLLNTTANTFILQHFGLLSGNAFIYMWIPRLIKEALNSLYSIYLLTALLKAYEAVNSRYSNRSSGRSGNERQH